MSIIVKGKQYKAIIHIAIKEMDNLIRYDTLEKTNGKVLSITGDLYYRNGNRGRFGFYSCGQIQDDILKHINDFDLDIDAKNMLIRLIEIWKKWHLNSFIPGTINQEKCLDKYYRNTEDYLKNGYDYLRACEVLKKHGLYVDMGYTYGSNWLYKPLPKGIEYELNIIVSKLNQNKKEV